jgi:hypothetical protein
MKKIVLILIAQLIIGTSFAQKTSFSGEWQWIKTIKDGVEKKEKTKLKFAADGTIWVEIFNIGNWKFNKAQMEVLLKNNMGENELNGMHKVLELTERSLIIQKGKEIYYFNHINTDKINQDNSQSQLAGTWKLNHKVFDEIFLQLELPNKFRFISCSPNTTTSTSGEWHFIPNTNQLELAGTPEQFILKGKSKIKDISAHSLALITPRETLLFDKVNPTDIEWLPFTIKDFEDTENNTKQLPKAWQNDNNFINHLGKLNGLLYDTKIYVQQAKALKNAQILKKIKTTKESVSISNIIMHKYDTLQYSENYKGHLMNQNNCFFPEEEPGHFRVIGKAQLNGYQCTIIEAINGDSKIKYWMIDNQPGVYAKIITQTENTFLKETSYNVITLNKSY